MISINHRMLLSLFVGSTLLSCDTHYKSFEVGTKNPIVCNRYEILPVTGSHYVAKMEIYAMPNRDHDELCMLADGWQPIPSGSQHIFRFTKPKEVKCPS